MDLATTNYGTVRTKSFDIAILPWGATEPHNYHLPYLTDCILSHAVAVDSARIAEQQYGVRGMVLPYVTMGSQNPGQRGLPFCIHARYETQMSILRDTVSSLSFQGINKLLIINGHGGNSFKNMIRDLAVEIPHFTIAVTDWFSALPAKDYFDNPGDHADELETSVMMHYHPELVPLEIAGDGHYKPFKAETLRRKVAWIPRDWSRISEDTGVGDPRMATAEKGARYASDVAVLYARLLKDLADGSYYE